MKTKPLDQKKKNIQEPAPNLLEGGKGKKKLQLGEVYCPMRRALEKRGFQNV